MFTINKNGTATLARSDGSVVDLPEYKTWRDSGISMVFPNGWKVSIQWGRSSLCEVGLSGGQNWGNAFMRLTAAADDPVALPWASATAEVAAWPEGGPKRGKWLVFDDGDTIKGYQSVDEVVEFMVMIAEKALAKRGRDNDDTAGD